jgi:hypothetical protein
MTGLTTARAEHHLKEWPPVATLMASSRAGQGLAPTGQLRREMLGGHANTLDSHFKVPETERRETLTLSDAH